MRKWAIYCRVSTDEQEQNWTSLAYQEETNKNFAKNHNLKVPDDFVFIEQYSWGFFNRPELDKLLQLAKKWEIDFVIFTKRDRIARSQYVYQKIKKILEDNDVEILLSIESTTWDKVMDNFIGSTFVQFAEWEREQIKQRTYAGKRQFAKNNKWIFSHIPYGYKKNPVLKELEIYESEKEVIRKIVDYFLYKNMTMMKIAMKLSEEKIICPAVSRNIKKWWNALDKLESRKNDIYYWSVSNIHKILTKAVMYSWEYQAFQKQYKMIWNKTILLKEREKEEWITLKIPAIISKEEAILIGEKLIKNRNFAKKRSIRNYMLQWKLFCDCEFPDYHNFVGYFHNGKWLRNYRCGLHNTSKVSHDRKCSNHISGLKIETIVIETLKEILTNPDYIFEKTIEEYLWDNEKWNKTRYEELYFEILQLSEKGKRNEELYIDWLIDKQRFLEIKKDLEDKKLELENDFSHEQGMLKSEIFKEQAKKNIQEIIKSKQNQIKAFFENANYDEFKELVNLLVHKIIVPVNKKEEIQIVLKIPWNTYYFQEKYYEDEFVEYIDEQGIEHYICPTGDRKAKKLKLDHTKDYEYRTIQFLEDISDENLFNNEIMSNSENSFINYLKEKIHLFFEWDHKYLTK